MVTIRQSKKWLRDLFVLSLMGIYGATGYAAPGADELQKQQNVIEQKERDASAKREDAELQRRHKEEMLRLQGKKADAKSFVLPEEENGFFIQEIYLRQSEFSDRFLWITEYLQQFENQRIGVKGINMLINKINEAIVDKGYPTTRIYIEEQDLSQGKLFFTLAPGTVRQIRFAQTNTWGTYGNAFPLKQGSLLAIRDIEQGLEQMKRIPSQDVDIQIAPADAPGQSDIILTVKRTKPWRLVTSLDNSGTKETGKRQASASFELDQLFSINDLFYLSINSDGEQAGERQGTRANSFYYSVPMGRATFAFSHSDNEYYQMVTHAVVPFRSSGEFSSDQISITHLLQRDQKSKTQLEYSITHKKRRSYINGTEIEVQRQNTTAVRTGIAHKQYIGQGVLDISLQWQKGVPWLGAQPGPTDGLPGEATSQYNIYLLGLSFSTPTDFIRKNSEYNLSIRGQHTNDRLYGSDFFSIGGRYTVRGFDEEQTLSAERGFVVRNELQMPIDKKHRLYTALDYGKVQGPSSSYLTGTDLLGGAIGVRGKIKSLQYDCFIGWPLHGPSGFTTEKRTYGFQFVQQM